MCSKLCVLGLHTSSYSRTQVARNKEGIENRLAGVLRQIQDRLPGIELFGQIYQENEPLDHDLQSIIVTAYQEFAAFCTMATVYYKMSRSS